MPPNYLSGIFYWRDHAGDLDGTHSNAGLRSILWACERWQEANPMSGDSDDGRRVAMIKSELEELLEPKLADD